MSGKPDEKPYEKQHRGDRGAYDRYLAGMDASMRQKVALTAAHLLCEGRVADMGMGSGTGSHALASLYPALEVVGVDVNETMVAMAAQRYDLPNLSFVVGDIATPVFEPGALDGIFDSSVLHHVTSFGNYDRAAAVRALEVQVAQLATGGVLIVRDFLDPGGGDVLLDVPAHDGDDSDDPRTCSTAALLERFAREFRSLSDAPGFALAREALDCAGWRRYRLDRMHAVEFVLRKDYRSDWESEVQEEYTYLTQVQFESEFARMGLRVLASTPLRNPWIVRNRFRDKFALRDTAGAALETPATNYIVVGERVPAAEGVRFEQGETHAPIGFLQLEHYRHRDTGHVMDVVYRPNATVDVLPWFVVDGDLFVLARRSYPRPILQAVSGGVPLDGARAVGYVTEPLTVIQRDRPLGQTAERVLAECAGMAADKIRGIQEGGTYYPSPGGVQEEVRSVFVEVEPVFVQRRIGNRSGFSTSGQVRAIEARQLLRAAQVGGLPDARLELNVYDLLRRCGRAAGPWIGETIELRDGARPATVTSVAALSARPARRVFDQVEARDSSGFLQVRCAEFCEYDAAGAVVARDVREWVTPRPFGIDTVAVAVLRRVGDVVYVGMGDHDLPASQAFDGNSSLLVAPAWRIPADLESMTPALAWVRARLEAQHGLACGEMFELGGRYHPSPGVTPEVVYAIAVEACGDGDLAWVPLADAVAQLGALVDGHLRIVVLRTAHALGLL